jgi:mRNA interferase RelE/StbE
MAYHVELKPRADKQLQALPRRVQLQIVGALQKLADEPRPQGVRKLAGEVDLYRIRVREHRIIYQIQDNLLLVLVVKIGHRRDIYRKGK